MKLARVLALAAVSSLVLLVACSDDDSSGGSTASSCAEAAKVSDQCNANQSPDSGATITVTFKQDECEKAGDNGKKAADCIVANKSNCDCLVKCAATGSCS